MSPPRGRTAEVQAGERAAHYRPGGRAVQRHGDFSGGRSVACPRMGAIACAVPYSHYLRAAEIAAVDPLVVAGMPAHHLWRGGPGWVRSAALPFAVSQSCARTQWFSAGVQRNQAAVVGCVELPLVPSGDTGPAPPPVPGSSAESSAGAPGRGRFSAVWDSCGLPERRGSSGGAALPRGQKDREPTAALSLARGGPSGAAAAALPGGLRHVDAVRQPARCGRPPAIRHGPGHVLTGTAAGRRRTLLHPR